MGKFSLNITTPFEKSESEFQQFKRNASNCVWIGNSCVAEMQIKEKRTVGKTVEYAQNVCKDVGMRLPTVEDFDNFTSPLYIEDININTFSDSDFKKLSDRPYIKLPDGLYLFLISNMQGDFYTASKGAKGENIIYNLAVNDEKTCRTVRNDDEFLRGKVCIRHLLLKPQSYLLSPATQLSKEEQNIRTICMSD